jgi:hypothetical protein
VDSTNVIPTAYAGTQRDNRLVAGVIVCGLHAALFMALRLAITRAHSSGVSPQRALVFIWTPAPSASPPAPRTRNLWRGRTPSRASEPALTAPADTVSVPHAVDPASAVLRMDWSAEATRSAAALVASEAAAHQHAMGSPVTRTSPSRRAKEFQWDRTVTERVEPMPGGGTLIRLNDNCGLVFAPLPMAGCWLGKREANGHLFDEIGSASVVGPSALGRR